MRTDHMATPAETWEASVASDQLPDDLDGVKFPGGTGRVAGRCEGSTARFQSWMVGESAAFVPALREVVWEQRIAEVGVVLRADAADA